MSVVRRPGQPDRTAILDLVEATGAFRPEEVGVAAEVLDGHLAEPNGDYRALVYATGGRVEGWIAYGPTPLTRGTWDIYWLAVHPRSQRRGIAAGLTDAAENEARARGGRLCVIETSSTQAYAPAREFYSKRGYREAARIADFYAPGDDRVILTRLL